LQNIIWILLLVSINFATFFKTKNFSFVWDDSAQIGDNEFVNPPTRQQIRRVWAGDAPGSYVPIKYTFLSALTNLDHRFSEGDARDSSTTIPDLHPSTFHLASVILHTANAILVFLVLLMLVKGVTGAVFGSLIFSLHPLQTEPIASVSSMGFLLGSFFALFALLKFLEFSSKQNSQNRKSRNPIRKYYLATGSFVFAMLAVPTMVVTPAIAFVLEKLLPRERAFMPSRKPVWPLLFWVILAVPVIIFTISAQNADALAHEMHFWSRPLVAADALTFYLQKILLPIGIGPDYGRSPNLVLSHWWSYLSWIIPFAITFFLLFWKEKSRSWIAGGFLVFLIALSPFLGLFAFEAQGTSTVASKYAYLALLGPALAVAYLGSLPRKMALRLGIIATIVALGFTSYQQVENWRDSESLWKLALQVNDSSPIAHRMLADQFRSKGEWDKAQEHYLMVLKSNTTDPETHFFLAQMQEKRGNKKDAIPLYEKVLELDPKFSKAHDALGLLLLANNDVTAALTHFQKSVEFTENDPLALQHLGRTLVLLEKYQEAIPVLRKSLKIGATVLPRVDAAAAQALLGKTLAAVGQKEMGQIHLESALRMDPNQADANRILADLYIAQGKFDDALRHYLAAVESMPDDAEVLNNLGSIYKNKQEYSKAKSYYERAIKISPTLISAQENLGVVNYFLHDYSAAKEQLTAAFERNPKLAESQYYLGEISRALGKEDLALSYYYSVLKIESDNALANSRLGEYFMKHDNLKSAIRHYRAALRKNPEDKKLAAKLERMEKAKGISEM
jgi:tetratricopeptide (TPR) repeat protein